MSAIKKYPAHTFDILLILLAVNMMWLLRNATLSGPGLINDSIAYIGGARSILAGTGYSQVWLASGLQPITHYPPLFPLTLVLIGLFGVDPFLGARIVNILLLGFNIVLVGLLGWRIYQTRFLGLLLALLFAISGAIFRVHSYAISEPLFMFFCLLGFLCLDVYIIQRRKVQLVVLGLLVGMAILDRYVGLALFGVMAVMLALFEAAWRPRLINLGIYLASALPIPLAWLVYNAAMSGTMANRALGWHPVTMDNLRLGVENLSHWLLPLGVGEKAYSLAGVILLMSFGIFLLVEPIMEVARIFKGPASERRLHLVVFTAAAFLWIYLASVLVSISIFDPATKFQDRILAPVYLSLLVCLVGFVDRLLQFNKPAARTVVICGVLLTLGFWASDFYAVNLSMRQDGQGYASRGFQESSVMRFIDRLPEDVSVYTDSPPAVYSATERASFIVPMDLGPGDDQEYYVKINEEIRAGTAVLVLFDVPKYTDPLSMANYQKLIEGAGLIAKFGIQRAYMGRE